MTKKSDPITEESQYQLWVLLRQVGHLMTELRREDLLAYNLTPAQAAALRTIPKLGDKATPAEIAKWLMRKPHSVSHLLDRMEECGQITKHKDLHYKHLTRIALTEKGKQDFETIQKAEYMHSIMDFIPEDQQEQLKAILTELRRRLINELGMTYRPTLPQ